MTDITQAKLDEMLAGLEGVTPGPYELVIHPGDEPQEDDIILWSTSQDANIGRLFPFMRARGAMPHRLNAEHFMRCDPDTMRQIITLAKQALASIPITAPAAFVPLIDSMTDDEFNRDRSDENPNVGKPITTEVGEVVAQRVVGAAMKEAWDDICSDTGFHPLDITQEGELLYYDPGHWAALVTKHINSALARPQGVEVTDEMVERLAQWMALDQMQVEMRPEYSWDAAQEYWRRAWRKKARAALSTLTRKEAP